MKLHKIVQILFTKKIEEEHSFSTIYIYNSFDLKKLQYSRESNTNKKMILLFKNFDYAK